MTPATRSGLDALAAGLAVGLAADLLLPVEPWGLNLFLSTSAMLGAGAWVARRARLAPSRDTAWLALSVLLLAAAFLRRDANMLQALDVATLVGLFGLTAGAAAGASLRHAHVGRYVATVVQSALSTLSGGLQLVFHDVAWRELPVGTRFSRFRGVALGALIAAPLLLLFGSLFTAADPVFGEAVGTLFGIDLANAAAHTVRTVVVGGLAAGYLRGIVTPRPERSRPDAAAPRADAGVPVLTALVLLNVLFLLFVLVQVRYFFGGAGRIATVAGLTYAEYARRGFFELVWASALVVPVLLGGDWAVRGAAAKGVTRFRIAATVTLALMAVVMLSALQRMRLYVAAFGLTEDRLYATVGMLYIAVLLGWLGLTVLRGRAERFAFGGTVQGLAVLGCLHAFNPDAFILRHNLDRAAAAQAFDVKYATSLSADAAPLLLESLPQLAPADACVAARRLAAWAERDTDWRTWNWARARAARLGRDAGVTRTVAGCPPLPAKPSAP